MRDIDRMPTQIIVILSVSSKELINSGINNCKKLIVSIIPYINITTTTNGKYVFTLCYLSSDTNIHKITRKIIITTFI